MMVGVAVGWNPCPQKSILNFAKKGHLTKTVGEECEDLPIPPTPSWLNYDCPLLVVVPSTELGAKQLNSLCRSRKGLEMGGIYWGAGLYGAKTSVRIYQVKFLLLHLAQQNITTSVSRQLWINPKELYIVITVSTLSEVTLLFTTSMVQ